MFTVRRLHHVEFYCHEARDRALQIANSYGFTLFASSPDAVAVRSGSTVFVFRERASEVYAVDTVRTVALEVSNVREAFDAAINAGATVQAAPTSFEDAALGTCSSAVVHTPFGNVLLMFIESTNYSGSFLPGFSRLNSDEHTACEVTDHCDHITFACPLGSLDDHVAWYEKALGFKRFTVNRAENDEDGFVVNSELGNVGLRLKAMDYWRCSEVGVSQNPVTRTGKEVKLVFAEPLQALGANQVQTFLDDHRGPGIQHIGLHTSDIAKAAARLQEKGVAFVRPPPEYYEQLRNTFSWPSAAMIKRLQQYHILLDVEEDCETADSKSKERYLMQAFTQSLFSNRTFFLELIHRAGAQGFGAGNISALWRALQLHLHGTSKTEKSKSS